ncbi:MAG: outer membrane beta-barrel protein [Bacteroidetes bacterium]|nr:outer membrane beta-barrel protein [Bacteroidota bacterium]
MSAQTGISGYVYGSAGNKPVQKALIVIKHQNGSLPADSGFSRPDGSFGMRSSSTGAVNISIRARGFEPWDSSFSLEEGFTDLGVIRLSPAVVRLDSVTIRASQGARQKGDTTEYNASNYKMNKDADAEQLVRKMPGITVENGQVKAQGENVQKVTIDGREFFGDDVNMALRSMPAEVVGRVQVFDRMSDQSFFTGFDDGNSQKAINLITRSGRNNGLFGKIYGGFGSDRNDWRYQSGAVVNWFKGIHRLTLLGMSNNINMQNFSSQDLLGLSGGGGGMGFSGMRGMRGMMGMMGGMRGGSWGGGGNNNFMVNQAGGINTTHSAGLNYSTTLGKKLSLTASYFFNTGSNVNDATTERDYYTFGSSSQNYKENSSSRSDNTNHRVNLRLEYMLDSMNSFTYTNRLSFQNQNINSLITANNLLVNKELGLNKLLNSTSTENRSFGDGSNLSHSLLYKRRFTKQWRTFSANITHDYNRKHAEAFLTSANKFYENPDTVIELRQVSYSDNNSTTLSGNLTYTEPSGKFGQWQISYQPSITRNDANKRTLTPDSLTRDLVRIDSLLSNRFNSSFLTHKPGLMYRRKGDNFNAMIGFNAQWTTLIGEQRFPYAVRNTYNFFNLLPTAMYQYRFSQSSNIRLFYRTNTNLPGAQQLQEVVDNSNPLLLSKGNSKLQQDFSQFFIARYGWSNNATGRNFFGFMMYQTTMNYIANSTFIAARDTVIGNGITLLRGAQLNMPVNLSGYRSVRSFLNYGLPLKAIKSNFNANGGVSYSRVPGLVNNITNFANTWNLNAGVVLSSNISEKIDFTLAYSAFYNLVNNTVRSGIDNNYLQQTGSFRSNLQSGKGWVFSSDLNYTGYNGLGSAFRQNFVLWNLGIGKKFLKNQAGELRITAFDILGQNNSLSRTVTETYVEDLQTRVLQRYFMLNFTYNIRKFKRGGGTFPSGGGSGMGRPF